MGRWVDWTHVDDHGFVTHRVKVDVFDHLGFGLAHAKNCTGGVAQEYPFGAITVVAGTWIFEKRHGRGSEGER